MKGGTERPGGGGRVAARDPGRGGSRKDPGTQASSEGGERSLELTKHLHKRGLVIVL